MQHILLVPYSNNQKSSCRTLDKLVNNIINVLSDFEKEKLLIAVINNKNSKRKIILKILKNFELPKVIREVVQSHHFDDDIFQLIRSSNDFHAIDMAIATNKLSKLSLISLGNHENEWIRKHALAKLSRGLWE